MVRHHGGHRHLLRPRPHHEGGLAASARQGARRLCRRLGLPAARRRAALLAHQGRRQGTRRQARPAHRRDPGREGFLGQGDRRAPGSRDRRSAMTGASMIRAFELAVRQLGDPKLRGVIWWSLLVSLVLQIGIAALAWWALRSFAHFEWKWINEGIVWLGGGAVLV